MWSGFYGHIAIVKILLEAPGIEVNKKNNVSDVNMARLKED